MKRDLEQKRSRVRRVVTYAVIFTYLGLASVITVWLVCQGKSETALAVLGGVGTTTASITGFWFGSRKPTDGSKQES